MQDTYNEVRNAFVNRQEGIRQNALAAQQDTAKQAAGQQFAGGDFPGAANTLAASGNIAGAQQVQTYSDTQRQQHAEAAQRITRGIRAAVNAGHTPAEAYDMATQAAPAIGVDPAELQKMRPAYDKDPRAFLDLVEAQSKKALEPYTLGENQVRYDANNKEVARGITPPKLQGFKADENVYDVSGNPASTPAASGAPAAPPKATGPVYDKIATTATQAGAQPADVGYLNRLAQVESDGSATAKNGKSTGVFQFHPDTFAGAGGTNINDVADQTKAALTLSQRDRQILKQAGIEPTDANTYIMHQQGAAGGRALLTASPDVGAVAALTPIYGSAKTATKAIVNNGGTPNMSAGDFVKKWQQKWGGGTPAPSGASGPGGARLVQAAAANPEDAPLSKEAIDMNATRVAMTGVMPSLGMGKAAHADRVNIQNRAAEMIKEWNVKPEDWVTGIAQFKVAQGSLSKISQTKNMVQASENAVVANMNQVVMPLMAKAAPGGVPFLNKYTMALRDRAFGDPDVKAYDNALHNVADEYAKVLTTTTGSGGSALSDSARAEAYRRLSTSQTPAQLQATFKAIQAEMDNRRKALEQQEGALTSQLRNGIAPPGATAPGAAAPAAPPAPQPAAPGRRPPLSAFQR